MIIVVFVIIRLGFDCYKVADNDQGLQRVWDYSDGYRNVRLVTMLTKVTLMKLRLSDQGCRPALTDDWLCTIVHCTSIEPQLRRPLVSCRSNLPILNL